MKKGYINCEYAFSPSCPERENPVWSKLLLQKAETFETVELSDINTANELCKNCDSFLESENMPPAIK